MGSFRNRLLVLIIGLVIVTQSVTLVAVLARTASSVTARGAEQLRAGGSFLQQLIRFRSEQLASGVKVLAADFGFREAVASGDIPTILSAAQNHSQRIGADLLLLIDDDGRVLASTAEAMVHPGTLLNWVLEATENERDRARFAVLDQVPYQFFLAPVRAPETIAWVLMGFVVDDTLAQRMRDLVAVDVSIIAHGNDRIARVASTLPPLMRDALAERLSRGVPGEPRVMRLGDTDYLSVALPIDERQDAIQVVLQAPMHSVLEPYRDVRYAMLLIGGAALVLAGIIGALLGRAASRPISELMQAARRIQTGQYDVVVAGGGGEEFQSLAETFNAMQRGIAEREMHIMHQVHHDPLTSLPNRAFVERHLKDVLSATRSEASVSLIAVDLRNMREINASLGHRVGDDVLREAARRLRQSTAPNDLVARLEGDQFLIVAPGRAPERARLLAERIAALVPAGFQLEEVSLDLRVAVGVCSYPEHGDNVDDLLRRVRLALEDAEESRKLIATYRPESDEEHRRRLELLADLRAAIDLGELNLEYQPKVAMATRTVHSVEALVRWTHPRLGPISPAEFVPLAERMGISRKLTSWVVDAAVSQMARWRNEGLRIEVAVNLSAPDILDADLGDEILGILRAHRIEPDALLLEITESAIMRDAPLAARNMRLLQTAGVRFAIDDFGTGYSSLSHLSRLPVDELKIDRSFIAQAHHRSEDAAIVTSTVKLGRSMGLKVVAEGIEAPEGWNLLRQLGCDFAQGYLISRPLPAADLAAFVRRANELLAASDSTVREMRALARLAVRE